MAFVITLFLGAAAMLAAGYGLGRRVAPDADWRRVLAIGVGCVVIGIATVVFTEFLERSLPVYADSSAKSVAGSAELLIAVALGWFGFLLGGVAWAHALRPPPPMAAPPAPVEPVRQEPTL